MTFSPCFIFCDTPTPHFSAEGIPKWDFPLNMAIAGLTMVNCSSLSDTPNYHIKLASLFLSYIPIISPWCLAIVVGEFTIYIHLQSIAIQDLWVKSSFLMV